MRSSGWAGFRRRRPTAATRSSSSSSCGSTSRRSSRCPGAPCPTRATTRTTCGASCGATSSRSSRRWCSCHATLGCPSGPASSARSSARWGHWQIFALVSKGKGDQTGRPSDLAARQAAVADQQLSNAAERYRADSIRALRESRLRLRRRHRAAVHRLRGRLRPRRKALTAAERLASENRHLLAASRNEALTDALTSLGNRRALMAELESRRPSVEGEHVMLALFDLDGFKQYNDSFGHPAGDSLLARLGDRLATTMEGIGSAYRMGGDEFCVLASVAEGGGRRSPASGRPRSARRAWASPSAARTAWR